MSVHDYASAVAYLSKARHRVYGRPLGCNTRLVDCFVGDTPAIGIRYHSTIVVAYLPDGSTVLAANGWHTVTTAKRLREYAPVNVYNGTLYTTHDDAAHGRGWIVASGEPIGYTPARVQKCRTCHGEGIRTNTYTQRGEWQMIDGRHVWEEWPEPVTTSHQYECYRCNGVGRADYGSAPKWHPFIDGVTLDQAGNVTGYGPAPTSYAPYVPYMPKGSKVAAYTPGPSPWAPSPWATGATVQAELRRLAPDVDRLSACPVCGTLRPVLDTVVHLNDGEGWSRGQIADWLDTLSLDLNLARPA